MNLAYHKTTKPVSSKVKLIIFLKLPQNTIDITGLLKSAAPPRALLHTAVYLSLFSFFSFFSFSRSHAPAWECIALIHGVPSCFAIALICGWIVSYRLLCLI